MDRKAKFTGKCYDKNGYAVHLFYEYRGREYMITDERSGYSEDMETQHKAEQRRIDWEIEHPCTKEPGTFNIDEIGGGFGMGLKQAIITTIDEYRSAGYTVEEIGRTITKIHLDGKMNKDIYMFAVEYLIYTF